MEQTLEVIYEDGVFRPVTPPDTSIAEGQRLWVRVADKPESVLDLLGQVYDGLPEEEIQEIEKVMLDRSHFFSVREQP